MVEVLKKICPKSIKKILAKIIFRPIVAQVEYKLNISHVGRMKDKNIMVTGATGAIGSAICLRLYAEGANVGVCGRNTEKISSVIKKISSIIPNSEGILIPLVLDVTDKKSMNSAIDEFVQKQGCIDIFINNAGGSAREKGKVLIEQNFDIVEDVLDVNLIGSLFCAKKSAEYMAKQNRGKIINISSVVGILGSRNMVDYAAAKSGIVGMTKGLAVELGEYGITVNAVSPGMVSQKPFDLGQPVMNTDLTVLKRKGYTDEVANLVAFICSDECNYITGHNFVIDGGLTVFCKKS